MGLEVAARPRVSPSLKLAAGCGYVCGVGGLWVGCVYVRVCVCVCGVYAKVCVWMCVYFVYVREGVCGVCVRVCVESVSVLGGVEGSLGSKCVDVLVAGGV